tara:strand:- start:1074 stop:1658 length:585 start_codon:yes stop_codon:yes gene_type:complete
MYSYEKKLGKEFNLIAGIDEVGRGPLAGPVVAAAVILDPLCPIDGIQDSKKLTPKKRDELVYEILNKSVSVSVASIGPRQIERINILNASLEAMRVSVSRLVLQPDFLLIDGNRMIDSIIPQETIVKGDSLCASIAAASIVAKVCRDRIMVRMNSHYPGYGFEKHKGYPTKEHLECIRNLGATKIHRRTFNGVN